MGGCITQGRDVRLELTNSEIVTMQLTEVMLITFEGILTGHTDNLPLVLLE